MNRSENAARVSRDTAAKRAIANTRHGHAKRGRISSEYHIWMSMHCRCSNPSDRAYANYGGRGIYVAAAWDSFEQFFADMGARPSQAHSLDRIDNDGPYSPSNCRWATRQEQRANQRPRKDAIWLEHDGERKTLDEWARLAGVRYSTMHARITRYGWDAARAVTTPSRSYTP